MAIRDVQPFVMNNAILTLGTPGDDYAAACSRIALVPSAGTTEFKGLKKTAVFTFPTSTTWTLEATFAQDWHIETSLGMWLYDHAGEIVPFSMDPDDLGEGHTSWAGEAAIVEGLVGGDVDTVPTSPVVLGVVGRPVPTFVAATP